MPDQELGTPVAKGLGLTPLIGDRPDTVQYLLCYKQKKTTIDFVAPLGSIQQNPGTPLQVRPARLLSYLQWRPWQQGWSCSQRPFSQQLRPYFLAVKFLKAIPRPSKQQPYSPATLISGLLYKAILHISFVDAVNHPHTQMRTGLQCCIFNKRVVSTLNLKFWTISRSKC